MIVEKNELWKYGLKRQNGKLYMKENWNLNREFCKE